MLVTAERNIEESHDSNLSYSQSALCWIMPGITCMCMSVHTHKHTDMFVFRTHRDFKFPGYLS